MKSHFKSQPQEITAGKQISPVKSLLKNEKKTPLTDSWQYGSFVRSVAVRGAEIIPDPVTDEKHAQTLSAFTKRAYGAADSRFYPLWCPAARSAASHARRSRSFEYSTRSFWPQTQACVILWGTQCFQNTLSIIDLSNSISGNHDTLCQQ